MLVAIAATAVGIGAFSWSMVIQHGMQLTGLNRPVGWGVFITDFVFWVGIAHSGTLISAILFLFRARFRTAVYRAAEAMTVFAVMTAGLFPVVHLGRPWFAYWIFPYPNQRHLWVNFRSPLVWDAFAISTYFVVSSLFLLTGLQPDAASLRDATRGWRQRVYAVARAWAGAAPTEEWRHYAPRLPLLRRPRHAAGDLGPQRRLLGLRGVAGAGLALDAVSALLRRRRDPLRAWRW